MKREIIRPLGVRDAASGAEVVLPAGGTVAGHRILRAKDPSGEPYLVEFESSGRRYSCPLHVFLPRTEAVTLEDIKSQQTSDVLAV